MEKKKPAIEKRKPASKKTSRPEEALKSRVSKSMSQDDYDNWLCSADAGFDSDEMAILREANFDFRPAW